MMILWFILAWAILVISILLVALGAIILTVLWQDRKIRKEFK